MSFYLDENIVNISMRAAELLIAGKIERDKMTGHAGLTETIIDLAEKFEMEYANVDFNEAERNYLSEIHAFAEKQLLDRYGVDYNKENEQLNIKVIITDGIVEEVLKDQGIPVEVEVVDLDDHREDYNKLKAYSEELYHDPRFQRCLYTVTDFQEEGSLCKVVVEGNNKEFGILFSGTWDECHQYCKDNHWKYFDENNLPWELEIQDPLEFTLSPAFYLAVEHFSWVRGADIHNGFVRQHADELVFCHEHKLDFDIFDDWTRYEALLGEKISCGEYIDLDKRFSCDLSDVSAIDNGTIQNLRGYLEGCRKERMFMSLDEKISRANNIFNLLQQKPAPIKERGNQRYI